MKSLFISPFRFYLTFFAVFFAFCSLGGRLVYLQVYKSDDYTKLANQARKNFIEIKARRGDIVDSKGNLLATTRSVVEVGIDPHSVEKEDWLKFDQLALSPRSESKGDSTGRPKSYQTQRTGRKGIQKGQMGKAQR